MNIPIYAPDYGRLVLREMIQELYPGMNLGSERVDCRRMMRSPDDRFWVVFAESTACSRILVYKTEKSAERYNVSTNDRALIAVVGDFDRVSITQKVLPIGETWIGCLEILARQIDEARTRAVYKINRALGVKAKKAAKLAKKKSKKKAKKL